MRVCRHCGCEVYQDPDTQDGVWRHQNSASEDCGRFDARWKKAEPVDEGIMIVSFERLAPCPWQYTWNEETEDWTGRFTCKKCMHESDMECALGYRTRAW